MPLEDAERPGLGQYLQHERFSGGWLQGGDELLRENGIFSQFGTDPNWSPYTGFVISDAITANQGNKFSSNTYNGQWEYMFHDQGTVLNLASRQAKGQD